MRSIVLLVAVAGLGTSCGKNSDGSLVSAASAGNGSVAPFSAAYDCEGAGSKYNFKFKPTQVTAAFAKGTVEMWSGDAAHHSGEVRAIDPGYSGMRRFGFRGTLDDSTQVLLVVTKEKDTAGVDSWTAKLSTLTPRPDTANTGAYDSTLEASAVCLLNVVTQ